MAVILPLKVDGWPTIRILTKPTWASKGAWVDQPMIQMGPKPVLRLGFEFLRCRRMTIDGDGSAVFRYVYGPIDGRQYPAAPDLNRYEVRIMAQDVADIPDGPDGGHPAWRTIWWGTVEQQMDVDMAPGSDDTTDLEKPYGTREYHCLDGVAGRMRHWPLNRHGVYISGGVQRPAESTTAKLPLRGHPGFNVMRWDGRIVGTKDSNSSHFNPHADLAGTTLLNRSFYHTYPGNGKEWTDQEAVETAISEARPAGEVPFYLDGVIEYLGNRSVWPVHEGMTCLDFLRQVLKRQRGRGVAICAWDESGDPLKDGTFVPKITIMPPFLLSLVYTPIGIDTNTGSAFAEVTLRGAVAYGSNTSVDLVADHRLGPQASATFELGDRGAYAVHYLETMGERIEVVATGSFSDPTPMIEKRWTDAEAAGLVAATLVQKQRGRYDPVYQLYGLARDWGGLAANGNAQNSSRADFRCDDSGQIVLPTGVGDTSPVLVEVMRDLPLYAEYNYDQNYPPSRYDGLTEDPVPPNRRAPLILLRTSNDAVNPSDTPPGSPVTGTPYVVGSSPSGAWVGHEGETATWNGSSWDFSSVPPATPGHFMQLAPTPADGVVDLFRVTFQVSDYGIMIFVPGDIASGTRTVGNTATVGLGSVANYTDIVMTIGLRLPHRVRFASAAIDPTTITQANPTGTAYTSENAPRRKSIHVPNRHLWLAHYAAIWDIDPTSAKSGAGYLAKRSPSNGVEATPGIIRDDRGTMEQIHRLAWTWYGTEHRTASWQLNCCGLLPQFTSGADSKSRTAFPHIGQLVSVLHAAGQVITLETPITVIDYDHVKCVTRWATDWCDLDVR